NELWTKPQNAGDAVADAAGNLYVVGFSGSTSVTKLDANGTEIWTRLIGSGGDFPTAVALDATGAVYVTGITSGHDVYVAKVDPAGNLLWITQFGSAGFDHTYAIGVDAVGNAYVVGETDGDLGGPNAGDRDIFLAKYTPDGTQSWVRQFGGSHAETP